ncbi:beta-glucosidase [Diaporthe amygdali]|uniref:beta-glucosidase n=1 Tax=Phomopsis amygdali TaxID=1214568 RepID=UPI0022FF20F9|nr:beta-glucosidase [Diaporthe amygdali]KAJ0122989.1 beta-glucosidase [Diaporthe amygdali]
MRAWVQILLGALLIRAVGAYWMEDVQHQGKASFNPDPNYQVFRNVKDFGARGDGVTDDTAAINAAINAGDRCGFGGTCQGTTTSPATVYFPAGTYKVSSPILQTYYTHLVGDPTSMPTIKAAADFAVAGGTSIVIESNQYTTRGRLSYGATNVFFRQIRNLVIDTTSIPNKTYAVHWPSSQATSIQNVVFSLSQAPDNLHTGIFMEEGSGGLLSDLVFYGGQYGAQFGNQQYTTQNLTFVNCQTAILQLWDWFWVYRDITIANCGVGINMTAASVGSAVIMDSFFYNVSKGIVSSRSGAGAGETPGQGTLVMENVGFSNVQTIFQGLNSTLQAAPGYNGSLVTGMILGNVYTPGGPDFVFAGLNDWFPTPSILKEGSKYYKRSKPQYEDKPSNCFVSARTFGAKGDGVTDDTAALTSFFAYLSQSFNQGIVGFVDAGYYKVTDTVHIPPNTRIVGEALASVIMGSGVNFSSMDDPRPVVQVGKPGDFGYIEWSDMIVSTQGPTSGAVLIEYNLSGCSGCQEPSGMWEVHIRVGGFAGSELQIAECPTTPDQENSINSNCIAAYLGMHITAQANDLYMENNWNWVADHDIEDLNSTQVSIYGGRGLLIESEGGRIWAVASSVEHWTLYQYQLINTQNIWMGQIQTETPYYQPNPRAPYPFADKDTALHDPDFQSDCVTLDQSYIPGSNITAPCEMAWALRIIDCSNVVIYGAGLYSFFNNYSTLCSDGPKNAQRKCQSRLVWIEDDKGTSENVTIYDLNTIGTISMVTNNGTEAVLWSDNWSVFGESIALFKP